MTWPALTFAPASVGDRREVGVARGLAALVLDAHEVAVAAVVGAGRRDRAARRGLHRRAGRRRDVGAAVRVRPAVLAVGPGDGAVDRRHRPAVAAEGGGRGLRLGRRAVAGLQVLAELLRLGRRRVALRRRRRGPRRRGRRRRLGLALLLDLLLDDRRHVPGLHEHDLRSEDRRPRARIHDPGDLEPVRGLEPLDRALGDRAEDPVVVDGEALLDLRDLRAGAAELEQDRAGPVGAAASAPCPAAGLEPACCAPATERIGAMGEVATAPVTATVVALRRRRARRPSSASRRLRCARSVERAQRRSSARSRSPGKPANRPSSS